MVTIMLMADKLFLPRRRSLLVSHITSTWLSEAGHTLIYLLHHQRCTVKSSTTYSTTGNQQTFSSDPSMSHLPISYKTTGPISLDPAIPMQKGYLHSLSGVTIRVSRSLVLHKWDLREILPITIGAVGGSSASICNG